MKTALEVGHSIHVQERRVLTYVAVATASVFMGLWLLGCTVSDLDLHVREGALGDAGVNRAKAPLAPVNP